MEAAKPTLNVVLISDLNYSIEGAMKLSIVKGDYRSRFHKNIGIARQGYRAL